MAKTRDAMKITDKMIGDDPERRARIAEAHTNLEIAELVYNARSAAGLTQKQLAELVGTGQSTIARLEDANYEGHSLSMLQRVATALGCQIRISLVPDDSHSQIA